MGRFPKKILLTKFLLAGRYANTLEKELPYHVSYGKFSPEKRAIPHFALLRKRLQEREL